MPFQKKTVVGQERKPLAFVSDEPAEKTTESKSIATDLSQLTPEELAIARRAQGEDDEWSDPIGEESAEDFSLSEDPFKLPEPAQKMKDSRKYAFRWIERKPERVDQIRTRPMPLRWWICNRANTPFLERFIDPVLGCVCREDQMLVFKPWEIWEREKAVKNRLRDTRNETGDLAAKNGQRQGGMEMVSSSRSMESGMPSRTEIKGSDVVMDATMRDILDSVDGGGQEFMGVD